jgi:hypothetical protein
MYCPRLIFRCFPNHLVHTWGFPAIVFRHSSNGKNLAAVRVGQQTLQGFYFAPSAFLRCLHDTDLESANVALDGRPVNGIPFRRFAGDRTNSVCCRHLLCLRSRLIKFSRVQHHGEVCPLLRSVMLSIERTQPISAPLQSSLRFLPDLLPAPPSIPLTVDLSPFASGERYGFILFR